MQSQPISEVQTQSPLISAGSVFVDPELKVVLPTGEVSVWHLSQNLTCRWGEINDHLAVCKPLAPLIENPELLERLVSQMWEESTFVVRKDGQYGILFEFEFMNQHSEVNLIRGLGSEDYERQLAELPTEEAQQAYLISKLAEIAPKYPKVEFCLAPREEVVEERQAIWAFFSDGQLSEEERDALGHELCSV